MIHHLYYSSSLHQKEMKKKRWGSEEKILPSPFISHLIPLFSPLQSQLQTFNGNPEPNSPFFTPFILCTLPHPDHLLLLIGFPSVSRSAPWFLLIDRKERFLWAKKCLQKGLMIVRTRKWSDECPVHLFQARSEDREQKRWTRWSMTWICTTSTAAIKMLRDDESSDWTGIGPWNTHIFLRRKKN